MKKLYWIIAITILCVSSNAFAFRISSTPAAMRFDLSPGKTAREVIEVKNDGPSPVGLRVYATGYSEDERGKGHKESSKFTAEKWISIIPSEFLLNSKDFGIIRYEVKVPDTAAPGTYGACIMIEQKPNAASGEEESDSATKSTGIRLLGRIGHVVTINIGKPKGYNVQLESFDINKEKTDFLIRVRNLGSFQYPYEGELKIFSGDKKVKEIRVTPLKIWPRSVNTRKVKMPKDLKPGTYSADLNIGGKKQGSLNASINFTISS